MAFDHYIPASYLGRFSNDTDPVRRKRRLWAVDKRENLLNLTTAGELCGLHNFYKLSAKNEDPRLVDSQWSGYENKLNPALDDMISGKLDALSWLQTLVVFVAALLVRGGDFETRFNERFEGIGLNEAGLMTRDNTNVARLMELQRLFASVIGARWLLLEASGNNAQITNDLGYTPFMNPQNGESGIAIPVSRKHILLLIACRKRVIAHAVDGTWVPNIERNTLEDEAHAMFLYSIASCAQRYVIGADETAMRKYLKAEATPPPIPEPSMLGFLNSEMAREYEMIYFNCLTRFSSAPTGSDTQVFVDYDKNMRGANREAHQNNVQPPLKPG
jgi:Protein of unknown function (DUF4238)